MTLNPLSDVILLLCLNAQPDVCERIVIPLEAPLLQCILAPPAEALQLLEARAQRWKLEDVTCRTHMVDS